MAVINSVLGPLDTADMGFTLPHEHVCSASAGMWQIWPEFFGGREPFIERSVNMIVEALAEGVRTFVDVTTVDLGRDIKLIEEVARRSGMQIIAATGHWWDPSVSFKARSVEELADLFTREIEQGMEGTNIKAGIIKVANDQEGITEFGEKLLKAAARAHLQTGVPITTHTYAPGRVGDLQADIFEEEGVKLEHVYIGHSNDTTNVNYLIGLARRGCYIGMDRHPGGLLRGPRWEDRTATVKKLIDAGFADRVMLSHDFPLGMSLGPTDRIKARYTTYNTDHILFITRKVLPRLRELGVSEELITTMTVDNPRRFFEG